MNDLHSLQMPKNVRQRLHADFADAPSQLIESLAAVIQLRNDLERPFALDDLQRLGHGGGTLRLPIFVQAITLFRGELMKFCK